MNLRRDRDSNPGSRVNGTTVFETAPIGHSGISPELLIPIAIYSNLRDSIGSSLEALCAG